MIKKNLFLLFCIYLFVVQTAICWLLRQENRFFILAGINLLALLLIAIIFRWKRDEESPKINKEAIHHEHKEYEVKESKADYSAHVSQRQKKSIRIPSIWFFIIAILWWILAWYWLWDLAIHLKLLVSIIWAYIIYIILGKLLWDDIFHTRESRIFLVSIILAFVYSIISFIILSLSWTTNFNWEWKFMTWLVDEVEVIWTGTETTWTNLSGLNLSWSNLSWENLWKTGENNTWTISDIVTWSTTQTWNIAQTWNLNKLATFRDVIKFLLADEKLLTTTNVSFQNISKTDPDYAYFRTAYGKQMIWSDLNPNKNPSCETFVVMKWLTQWWNVWSYSDVKQAYRKYASSHNALPGCKYGSYIKIWEMK